MITSETRAFFTARRIGQVGFHVEVVFSHLITHRVNSTGPRLIDEGSLDSF